MNTVALNSATMLNKFRSTASMMTNADYNLPEIVGNVIRHLYDGNNMNDITTYYTEVMVSRGDDGVILSRAIKELAESLKVCLTQMKLYDRTNTLHYRLQTIVSHTIIVERV